MELKNTKSNHTMHNQIQSKNTTKMTDYSAIKRATNPLNLSE